LGIYSIRKYDSSQSSVATYVFARHQVRHGGASRSLLIFIFHVLIIVVVVIVPHIVVILVACLCENKK